jgi:hypothetical protein
MLVQLESTSSKSSTVNKEKVPVTPLDILGNVLVSRQAHYAL